MQGSWLRSTTIPPRTYTCAHPGCGQEVTATHGYSFLKDDQYDIWWIYLCPQCLRPTFVDHYENLTPSK